MEKTLKKIERIPGGIGIISIIIISIMGILSYIYYPSYKFKLFSYVVSELGVGEGALFFNLGLILSGIFLIPFFLKLNLHFSKDQSEDLRNTLLVLGGISSCSYLLLGFFPLNLILHMIMVFNIFMVGMVNGLLLVIIIIKNYRDARNILVFIGILNILSIFSYFFTLLFYYSIHSKFEWIMVFLFGLWVICHSFYLVFSS
jgi:hypothetical protein